MQQILSSNSTYYFTLILFHWYAIILFHGSGSILLVKLETESAETKEHGRQGKMERYDWNGILLPENYSRIHRCLGKIELWWIMVAKLMFWKFRNAGRKNKMINWSSSYYHKLKWMNFDEAEWCTGNED